MARRKEHSYEISGKVAKYVSIKQDDKSINWNRGQIMVGAKLGKNGRHWSYPSTYTLGGLKSNLLFMAALESNNSIVVEFDSDLPHSFALNHHL